MVRARNNGQNTRGLLTPIEYPNNTFKRLRDLERSHGTTIGGVISSSDPSHTLNNNPVPVIVSATPDSYYDPENQVYILQISVDLAYTPPEDFQYLEFNVYATSGHPGFDGYYTENDAGVNPVVITDVRFLLGATYSVRVRVITARGAGSWSDSFTGIYFEPSLSQPDPPSALQVNTALGQDGFDWVGNHRAIAYMMFTPSDPEPQGYIFAYWGTTQERVETALPGDATSTILGPVDDDQTYDCEIWAFNGARRSTSAVGEAVFGTQPLGPFTDLAEDTGNCRWSDNDQRATMAFTFKNPGSMTGIMGWAIYVEQGDVTQSRQVIGTAEEKFEVLMLGNMAYEIYGRAINEWGGEGPDSNHVTGTALSYPTRPAAPNVTNPVTGGVNESGGYYARPTVNKNDAGDDSTGGGVVYYVATDGNSDRPKRSVSIPAGSTFPYKAYVPNLAYGVTYAFTATIINYKGQESLESSPARNYKAGTLPAPIPDPDPPQWDNGHIDQLFAGWLPVSPATDSDFALDASVASFGGNLSLKVITPINTDKAIVSPLIKCHEGDVLLFGWAGKRGIGTGAVPNGLLKIQHYAQDGTTTVGSLTTLDTITGLPTVYPAKLRTTKQTAPSGSFGYTLTLVSSGQAGASSSYNVWFSSVQVWLQVTMPAFFKPLATSTDPFILPDADGDPAVSIYQTGDVSSDGGAQSLLAAGNFTLDVGNAGQANGDLQIGASGGAQITTQDGAVIDGGVQIGGAGTLIMLHMSAVANLAYSTIKSLEYEDQTVTVTGAQAGDTVVATPASDIGQRHTWCAWVSAADTVTVRVFCISSGSGTPAQVDWTVDVWNH